jgi:hypothetical protein
VEKQHGIITCFSHRRHAGEPLLAPRGIDLLVFSGVKVSRRLQLLNHYLSFQELENSGVKGVQKLLGWLNY